MRADRGIETFVKRNSIFEKKSPKRVRDLLADLTARKDTGLGNKDTPIDGLSQLHLMGNKLLGIYCNRLEKN